MLTLEEKKNHEVKLRESLNDLSVRRVELQNTLSSSWPKHVSDTFLLLLMSSLESISGICDANTICKSWLGACKK